MADFCRQCWSEMVGDPEAKGDFFGLITEEDTKAGYVAPGICEGCIGGEFDHEGYCLGAGCLKPEHRSPHHPGYPPPGEANGR